MHFLMFCYSDIKHPKCIFTFDEEKNKQKSLCFLKLINNQYINTSESINIELL